MRIPNAWEAPAKAIFQNSNKIKSDGRKLILHFRPSDLTLLSKLQNVINPIQLNYTLW